MLLFESDTFIVLFIYFYYYSFLSFAVVFHKQVMPRGYNFFSCLTQLRMNFFLLINVKKVVGILTFMSRKNTILGLYEPEET